MLELLRKIFGCYHDNALDREYLASHEQMMRMIDSLKDNSEHTLTIKDESELLKKDETKEIIGNIISAVVSEKEKGFISYMEEAQDSVTGSKFKFIKYRS